MNKILSYAFLALFPLLASCSSVPQELPVVAEEALPKPVEGAAVQEPRHPIILNADRILSVLGEPTVRRFEAPSEVWVYSQPSCVLFIYMNDKGEPSPRVRHMEIGTPSFGIREKQSADCLKLASRLR